MRNSELCVLGMIGLVMTWPGVICHVHAAELLSLTDAQLDKTTAGVTFAVAIGDGIAEGARANGHVSVLTMVGLGNEANTIARGQVTSVATSSGHDPTATASSSLMLRVIIP